MQQREREERTSVFYSLGCEHQQEIHNRQETVAFLSPFTTHSSDCLFSSWYVHSVHLYVIFISVCPCLYISLHIL